MTDEIKQYDPVVVAAYTHSARSATSRFRVRQYIPWLAERGVMVDDHIPLFATGCRLPSPFKTAARIPALWTSRRADVVWLNRELVQGYATFERWLKRPRVMDVDDAIWLDWPLGRRCLPGVARAMDTIVAGNAYLADWFGQYCKDVRVMPTAIDVERYRLRDLEQARRQDEFVIGWTGLASNYKFLDLIGPALTRFFADHDDARLWVMAQRPWQQSYLAQNRVRFIKWSPAVEAEALREMTVGIMPLPNTEWTRGKCSFKMLQYLAVGLPVVVSPVGMNREVLQRGTVGYAADTQDQWYDALHSLYQQREHGIQMGLTGRGVIESEYNTALVTEQLARLFRELAGR